MEYSHDMKDRILGNISTAIVLLDQDLHLIFCNPAAEALLQASGSHLHGHCITELVGNPGAIRDRLDSALANSQPYTQRKAKLSIQTGDEITVDLTVTPVNESSSPLLLLELIPLDRYLRIGRDATVKENNEVSRMMTRGLAHEIKNPLGGIKGSAQLLARQLEDEQLQEYTNIIVEEADRLTTLVDSMLGPCTLPEVSATNIHELLERAAALIELEAEDLLTLVRDYDPSIPELEADPELLLQALLNLARNAMQCLVGTRDPTITIRTRIERQITISGQRHRVALRVDISDNGPGIPEDIREHLFFPMVTRRPGGTGLGLTLAQNIVNQHKGLVEFDSEPGKTVFSILIPLARKKHG